MKKILVLLLMMVVLCGVAFADDDDDDDREHYRGSHCYILTSWRNPCCNSNWNSANCYKKRYKKWYKTCNKHHGKNCSYDYWYSRRDYDDDYWFDYWNTDAYRNVQKVNHKINVFRRVVDSTKELFTW